MTPAEFRNSLKRQGLGIREFARLIYSSKTTVDRWAKGQYPVSGAARAYLELREGRFHATADEKRQGVALLHYCKIRGLDFGQAKNAIWAYLRHKRERPRKARVRQILKRKADKADEWGL